MPASAVGSLVFRDIFGSPAMREVWSHVFRIQKYLDWEAALARAEAKVGLIPHGIVGDSLNGLTDSIRRQGKIESMHVRHEEVAGCNRSRREIAMSTLTSDGYGGQRLSAPAASALARVAGGAMDDWVYLAHGHVFANAQSGNVVLMGVALAGGDVARAATHLPSLVAFVTGLLASRLSAQLFKRRRLNSYIDWSRLTECVPMVSAPWSWLPSRSSGISRLFPRYRAYPGISAGEIPASATPRSRWPIP